MTKQDNESKGLWLFFFLTYTIMLLTWGLMAIIQIPGASAVSGSASLTHRNLFLFFLGGFSPSIAGVLVTWRVGGRTGLRGLWRRAVRINSGLSSYLVIFILPLIILGLRICVHAASGDSFLRSPLLTHPLSLIGFTILMIFGGAVSEEFGWRGFALDRMLARWSLGMANSILGLLWAFWHLPLFFIPGTIQSAQGNVPAQLALFVVWIIGLTFVYSWLHIRSGRSLFAVILFHAMIDWSSSFAGTLMRPGLTDQLTNAAATALFAIALMIGWRSVPPVAPDYAFPHGGRAGMRSERERAQDN